MGRDVPLRRSLLLRMLALSVLVSLCSVAATAWLAVRTTTGAIEQEQGRRLADDTRIYDTLLGYAATHPGWSGVEPAVRRLAGQTGRRIELTTQNREPVADSAPSDPRPPPTTASAVVDPLAVDAALKAGAGPDRIDPRAVGPFALSAREREELDSAAAARAQCYRGIPGVRVTVAHEPNGRPRVTASDGLLTGSARCKEGTSALDRPTPIERQAGDRLDALVDVCLSRQGLPGVRLAIEPSRVSAPAPTSRARKAVSACLVTARREQLTPYVAPAALLFVTTPGRATGFDLSPANRARVAGVAALVLLLGVAVTALAGLRLVRPLHALTRAAQRMTEGDTTARVKVTGGDEIGRLAAVFNDMSEQREHMENLRRAMVGDVAHELRTPLSNIRGWLEAVEDGVADADPPLLSSLLEEALQLQHIIDDLRDLAEADAGELSLRKERVDVAELLAQVAVAHRRAADSAGITLSTAVEGDPSLLADPVRLRQAVANLLSNAVRHTPPGGHAALRAHRDGDQVVIEVADTGAGMAAEDVPMVFERFWRADTSRTRQTGGSGLGLSIVRKLAEAHGGTVSASSVLGRGSVFTLRLPG